MDGKRARAATNRVGPERSRDGDGSGAYRVAAARMASATVAMLLAHAGRETIAAGK
jgi:hypothetical protein